LPFYPPAVKRVVGLDPHPADGLPALEERIRNAPFEVERCALRADGALPFDAGRFDSVVTTWTLCSIPDFQRALAEMRRVLRPGGRYLFIEHGRSPAEGTARWQDRVN
ncbi:MAG: methyltransferase domain-containing protein, partial [Gemmatimonadetes bacterium]|nr:class I SAM-dependent methyltransferase [Gemmatimonadota bacterium]NIU72629.1 methyltransferase domain-containing protein [Gammaproteobacteria bacterium]NIW37838.1 methyltransferase domain-containing protein [Gemmatimonadota bacterium]NIX43030.1 methyltransferase domain-containing protein [Gemmatimonadota bacterium]NIY07203.1 methyltransferase domain-containing protein [Gemmatimonadota bacterium]